MYHPTLLARIRQVTPALASAVYALWLGLLCTPIPVGGCCGNGSPEPKCDESGCSDKRKVTIKVDRAGIDELGSGIRTWSYTITGEGVTVPPGTFSSTNTGESPLATFCAPLEKKITVTITQTGGPPPPATAADPTYSRDTINSGTSFETHHDDLPSNPDPNSSTSSSGTSSGSCLLKLTWCSSCSDPGEKCFKLGEDTFDIPKDPCSGKTGGACAKPGSVEFRINLGRRADGRPIELVIHEDSIADALDPLKVQYPSIVNLYELEIWHWFGCVRHFNLPDGWERHPEYCLTGYQSVYQFLGQDGYKELFERKNIFPLEAGNGNRGPTLPFMVSYPQSFIVWKHVMESPEGVRNAGLSVVSNPLWIASTAYHDRVIEQTTQELCSGFPAMPGIRVPASAIGGNLEDYIRRDFQQRVLALESGARPPARFEDDEDIHPDEIRNLEEPPGPYNEVLPIATLSIAGTAPAGEGVHNLDFEAGEPQDRCYGASYCIRNLALSQPGASGTLPGAGGSSSIVGPEAVIQIEPYSPVGTGYAIKGYWRSQVTANSNGQVVFNGAPFATWSVTRPLANQLLISETRNSQTVATYLWEEDGTTWSLATTKGIRQEVEVKEEYLGGEKQTITVTDLTTEPKVISSVERIIDSGGKLRTVTEGLPADGQRVTTYEYDTAGKLSYFKRDDGSFEIYKTFVDSGNLYGGGTFDATIRPWLDLAFNANLTVSQGAVTLTKTVLNGAQEDRTTIELINGTVMSTTVAVSTNRSMTAATDPWLDYRLTNGTTLPVRRTVTTRTASGGSEVSISETFTQGAPASLAGRPAYRKDPDGKVTVYHHYRPGTYSALIDSVQQGGDGGDREVYEVTYDGRTNPFGVPFFQGDCFKVITDVHGRVRSRTHLTWVPGDQHSHLARMSWTKNLYDDGGNLTQTSTHTAQDTSITYSASYDQLGRKELESDATGAQTYFSAFDFAGQPQSITQMQYFADGDLPAIPERAVGQEHDAASRAIREYREGFMTERQYDSLGRLTQEVEGVDSGGMTNGRTTQHSETIVGVNTVQTTTHPSGATTITETYPDGQAKSITGTAQPSQLIQRFVGGSGFSTVALPGGLTGGFVVEQTTTAGEVSSIRIVDGLGRTLADYVLSFNASQQLAGSWRTYTYDSAGRVTHEYLAGELVRQVSYYWGGDQVETIYATPSPNQVRSTVSVYSLESNGWNRITTTSDGSQREKLYGDGSAYSHTVFVDLYNRETTQTSSVTGVGKVTTTIYTPEANNPSVTIARGGMVQSAKGPATDATIYGYDALGRQVVIAAPGGINTTITYDAIYGQAATITTSGSTLGAAATTTTSMTYFGPTSAAPGQVETRTVDGRTTNYSYYLDGSLKATWGADYPQKYEYLGGRLYRLHTYRSAPAGEPTGTGDVTEWAYKFGLLWKKTDAASKSITYSYDTKGRLFTRAWARSVTTTYTHDRAGQLRSLTYSDGTPSVTIYRDAQGKVTSVTSSGAVNSVSYVHGPSEPDETVTVTGGVYGGFYAVSRVAHYSLANSIVKTGVSYVGNDGYSVDELPEWVFETAGGTMTNANGMVIGRHSATGEVTTGTYGAALIRTYVRDGIGRLKRVETGVPNGAIKSFMDYTYVNGQREQAETHRGTWHYGYNGRREVVSGVKKITNTTVPGYNFGYLFDGIGNRESATTNGITDVYTPNAVNQYEQRTVPAYFQVRGLAQAIPVTPPATPVEPEGVAVKLEGLQSPYTEAAFGPANYFGLALPVPSPGNQNNALWKGITTEAWANTGTNEYKVTETRKDFLPKNPEDYDYDDDGNLIKDGRWAYQWDGENRLISMTARTADFPGQTLPAGMDVGKLEFKYDWQGRRMVKLVYGQDGTTLLRWTSFVYDGWQLLHDIERHITGGTISRVITRNYYWGPDVSGTMQGAGGVGGLVSVYISDFDVALGSSVTGSWVPAYDGNGNVVGYLDPSTGELSQDEEYGPFGEALRSRSTALLRSPIGWSTKYTDEETGLVYYGYRYYAPQTGRWVSRDPIEERGGANLNGLTGNNTVNGFDLLGREWIYPYEYVEAANPPSTEPPNPNSENGNTVHRHYLKDRFYFKDVDVTKCKAIAKDIYIRMKEFKDWNPNSVTSLSFENRGGQKVAKFTPPLGIQIQGLFALNDFSFRVAITYQEKELQIQARTLAQHPLVGMRRWNVKSRSEPNCACVIDISTEAFEASRNFVNEIGRDYFGGGEIQTRIWRDYFRNIQNRVKSKWPEFEGSIRHAETPANNPIGSTDNPWF